MGSIHLMQTNDPTLINKWTIVPWDDAKEPLSPLGVDEESEDVWRAFARDNELVYWTTVQSGDMMWFEFRKHALTSTTVEAGFYALAKNSFLREINSVDTTLLERARRHLCNLGHRRGTEDTKIELEELVIPDDIDYSDLDSVMRLKVV